MTAHDWGIVLGLAVTAVVTALPWMFMVHARLAVLADKIAQLQEKVDVLLAAEQERVRIVTWHEAELQHHRRRLDELAAACEAAKTTDPRA